MDIEKKIFTEEECDKLEELRRKNVVDKINKENSIQKEKEHKEWREKVNTKTKVLNLGVPIREEFKKMHTRELLGLLKSVRFRNRSSWDDDSDDLLEELELKTELSQREHVETDKSILKKKRQLAAKKNRGGRKSHKKK